MKDTESEAIRELDHSERARPGILRGRTSRGVPEPNDLRDAAVVMGSTLGPLAVVVPFFFIFILIGGIIIVAVHFTGLGTKAPAAYAIGAMLIITGIGIGAASFLEGPDDGPTYCEEHPEDPACTGGEWRPVFDVGIPETPAGAGRDAANEVPEILENE